MEGCTNVSEWADVSKWVTYGMAVAVSGLALVAEALGRGGALGPLRTPLYPPSMLPTWGRTRAVVEGGGGKAMLEKGALKSLLELGQDKSWREAGR